MGLLSLSLLSLGLLCLGLPSPANAQVNRCTTPEGNTVYTDQACAMIGAVDSLSRTGTVSEAPRRRACNRDLQDLVFDLTAAIDNRDTNRLSSLYHWPGISTSGGYAVMTRLDAIAQRPLAGITELYSDPSSPPATPSMSSPGTHADIGGTTRPPSPQASPPSQPTRAAQAQRHPSALRLEQTLADQATPSQSVFALRRHLGCWWISF